MLVQSCVSLITCDESLHLVESFVQWWVACSFLSIEPLGVEALAGSSAAPPSSLTASAVLLGVIMAGLSGFSPFPSSSEPEEEDLLAKLFIEKCKQSKI